MSRQFATFTLDGARYGVDVLRVQEALRAQARTPVPLAPAGIAGLVNLRGQVVMTIDLRTRLGIPARSGEAEPMMIVVQVDGEPISLLVDEIGDVIEPPREAFEAPPETVPASVRALVSRVCKLDRQLMLLLDTERAAQVLDPV